MLKISASSGECGFTVDSMLVSEYSADNVAAYQLDAERQPDTRDTRRFHHGTHRCRGSRDRSADRDFLFSTFLTEESSIIVVQGFVPPPPPVVPEPSSLMLLAAGLAGLFGFARRRAA